MPRTIRRMAPGGTTQAPTGGTLGGIGAAVGSAPGRRPVKLGDEVYLWILVGIEVTLIAWGRSAFSRYHGG